MITVTGLLIHSFAPLLACIVGFGTSAPMLLIFIAATITQQPDIAFGNISGSNLLNT